MAAEKRRANGVVWRVGKGTTCVNAIPRALGPSCSSKAVEPASDSA